MSKISIVRGENRKENIKNSIKIIGEDINKAIKRKGSKMLFIKINAIDPNFPDACTHIDALDSVLDVFYNKFDEIVVGDNTFAFIKNKGGYYRHILKKFPRVRLSDLTEFPSENIIFKKLDGKTSIGKLSLLHKKAFTISLALPKTHDAFVYTGCLKNMFGCVIKNRGDLHAQNIFGKFFLNKYVKSNKIKWENLIEVINRAKSDLCVLDGYNGMEGNGPLFGSSIKLGIAVCSLDGIALDMLVSKICGFEHVPYLEMLPSDKEKEAKIIKKGFKDIREISKKFKPHYNQRYQLMKSMSIPFLDVRMIFSVLKRFYRIKDKIIERIIKPNENFTTKIKRDF